MAHITDHRSLIATTGSSAVAPRLSRVPIGRDVLSRAVAGEGRAGGWSEGTELTHAPALTGDLSRSGTEAHVARPR
jgi:hypothetical protein